MRPCRGRRSHRAARAVSRRGCDAYRVGTQTTRHSRAGREHHGQRSVPLRRLVHRPPQGDARPLVDLGGENRSPIQAWGHQTARVLQLDDDDGIAVGRSSDVGHVEREILCAFLRGDMHVAGGFNQTCSGWRRQAAGRDRDGKNIGQRGLPAIRLVPPILLSPGFMVSSPLPGTRERSANLLTVVEGGKLELHRMGAHACGPHDYRPERTAHGMGTRRCRGARPVDAAGVRGAPPPGESRFST
jgi:hypothetical protein